MDILYYQIFWQLEDGTRQYHIDLNSGNPWRFYSYDECFGVGNRIDKPSINAKLMFEGIRK